MAIELSRRSALVRAWALGSWAACSLAGCGVEKEASAAVAGLEKVWGVHGKREGRLHKPRAVAIDAENCLYLADLTDRIQVFDRDGQYLRGWRTPGLNVDGPSGVTVDANGRVIVADTHFYRVLVYDQLGNITQQLGDGVQGTTPGRFGYATDVVVDRQGNFYVSEYGELDRIQVFTPDGQFVRQWGGHGSEPGWFLRPRALAIDADDLIYVADSCNHRIQVFEPGGSLVRIWGERGTAPGQLSFPYDVSFSPDGMLLVCEYGNGRVQKFTREGKSLGMWGSPGREPGQLDNPFAVCVDSLGVVHVVDSGNHRVQRVRF